MKKHYFIFCIVLALSGNHHFFACQEAGVPRRSGKHRAAEESSRERAYPPGWTALHIAAFLGRTEVVALLLKADASVNKRDSKGRTPLLVTSEAAVANLLIQAGADLEAKEYPRCKHTRGH